MTDVIIIEQCCHCHRNLSVDKLTHNKSSNVYYCSDTADCRIAQGQNQERLHKDSTGAHSHFTKPNFSFHYRQSGCGNAFTGFVVGTSVFFGSWIYAIKTYGWFLGLGLGWIPSFFLGIMAAIFWPVAVLVILGILIFSY
ncbi:MAG: hypothetical protein FIB02_02105 [Desulfuromonas sp.]|nr:hypothetical protein [Desulfuromonas sp.]